MEPPHQPQAHARPGPGRAGRRPPRAWAGGPAGPGLGRAGPLRRPGAGPVGRPGAGPVGRPAAGPVVGPHAGCGRPVGAAAAAPGHHP
ncbi:hypothetical protein [Ornithinimicrobium kibberense]|uniref:hypothetical protein n=1 Tax=Ornithinimicrobium kibberense TaxID=282060 RepID=UPI0036186940